MPLNMGWSWRPPLLDWALPYLILITIVIEYSLYFLFFGVRHWKRGLLYVVGVNALSGIVGYVVLIVLSLGGFGL